MREARFRAWDKVSNRFYWYGSIMDAFWDEFWTSDNVDLVFDESTGLKDRNDVEIFQGDILEYVPLPSFGPTPKSYRFTVEWKGKGFRDHRVMMDVYKYERGVVIGNIHEHKDLMQT